MSLKQVMEDWSEYDAYKEQAGRAPQQFLTEDEWEVSFLINKIRASYPAAGDEQVLQGAVAACGRMISMPRQRLLLVQCVLKRLDLI